MKNILRFISYIYQLSCILLSMILLILPLIFFSIFNFVYLSIYEEDSEAVTIMADVFIGYFEALVADFIDDFYTVYLPVNTSEDSPDSTEDSPDSTEDSPDSTEDSSAENEK